MGLRFNSFAAAYASTHSLLSILSLSFILLPVSSLPLLPFISIGGKKNNVERPRERKGKVEGGGQEDKGNPRLAQRKLTIRIGLC